MARTDALEATAIVVTTAITVAMAAMAVAAAMAVTAVVEERFLLQSHLNKPNSYY